MITCADTARAVTKADVRRRMSRRTGRAWPAFQKSLGIPTVITLYKWRRKTWRYRGMVVPASEKDPDGLSAADKFHGGLGLETASLKLPLSSAHALPEAGPVFRGRLERLAPGQPRICQCQAGFADDWPEAEGARKSSAAQTSERIKKPSKGACKRKRKGQLAEMGALLVLRKKGGKAFLARRTRKGLTTAAGLRH